MGSRSSGDAEGTALQLGLQLAGLTPFITVIWERQQPCKRLHERESCTPRARGAGDAPPSCFSPDGRKKGQSCLQIRAVIGWELGNNIPPERAVLEPALHGIPSS